MPAGSVVVFLGTLWHRGGANRSAQPRLAITPQYCEPWLRQIEQQVLAVPPEMAARYSERVQQLLGYSIHAPFMGYVDGVHPRRLIEQARGLQPGASVKATAAHRKHA
jgi:ectoine hydroxylase-related dioxygenase (phytanoyl-CoA dioxygenase family)